MGWSRMNKFVALDYDSRQVRLAVCEALRGELRVESLHAAAVPPEASPANADAFGRFLGSVIERLGLRNAAVVMAAGRSQAVLKSVALPPNVLPEELASMVQFQVARELPFQSDEAVVDYTLGSHWAASEQPASGEAAVGEASTSVLAAAVRLPVVDAARTLCQAAGLRLQRLGLRPYACLRALRRCVRTAPGERLLLVNLTSDEVEIDLVCGEDLEFSRAATVAVPAGAGVAPVRAAGRAAEAAATQDAPGAGDQAPGDTESAVRRVVEEVVRSLHSFHAVQRSAQLGACLVAGGTGLEQAVREALAQRLGVRCELLDPSPAFGLRRGEGVSSFIAALGLAAGQCEQDFHFDFLNPKRPVVKRDTRKLRLAAALVAGALVLVALLGAGHAHVRAREAQVRDLKNKCDAAAKENSLRKALAARLRKVDAWLDQDVDWLGQLAYLSNTLPEARQLYLTKLNCQMGTIKMSGRVRDRETVLGFSKTLMDQPGYNVRPGTITPLRDRQGLYDMDFVLDLLIDESAARKAEAASKPASRPTSTRAASRPAMASAPRRATP